MRKENIVPGMVTLSTAGLAAWCLAWWLGTEPSLGIGLRLDLGQEATVAHKAVRIEGTFQALADPPVATPKPRPVAADSWPGFRGPDYDNVSRDSTPLTTDWDEEGPPVLWTVALGEGYAGPAIHNDHVYLLDYDLEKQADALRCFALDDGREIWRRSYEVVTKRNHGMSRTVPAVTDDHVVTIGPRCQVMCCDTRTGAFRWGIDLVAEQGTEVPLWYTGQCPLIDGDVVVLAPGGKSLLLGVDCATGDILWETPNPKQWGMTHSSVIPVTLLGRRMFVYCAAGGVLGVAADGPERGTVLWETSEWNPSVMAPSPVPVGEDRLLLTAGYGAGSMMIRLATRDGGYEVMVENRFDRKQFACEQHTPINIRGHLYTVLPADAGEFKKQLVCMKPDGNIAWRSGREHRFGMGPFMVADNKLFIMDDDGHLTVAAASTTGYEPLASAQVLTGRESWGPLAVVEGRLLVRDFTEMRCLDLRERQKTTRLPDPPLPRLRRASHPTTGIARQTTINHRSAIFNPS